MAANEPVFTQKLISPLQAEETLALLSILESSGLISFLVEFPLSSIEFVNGLTDDNGNRINGQYDFKLQAIQVDLHRNNPRDFGQIYEKQGFWSISCLAPNPWQAIQRTLIHEVGHHVFGILLQNHLDLVQHIIKMPPSFAISVYGLQSTREYFAECFSAFLFQRTELFTDDSRGYDTVMRVLERLELELQELS